MSQSPTPSSSSAEILQYDKGWAALNRLIRAGRSFSGREKNCCFLNTGSQRFANVSAATDLDLPDDGRGLSVTDWDHDGRLDFWVTNRNGPRVRFLKNNYRTDNDFVSLKLVGTRTNRDAVGARVTLYLADTDKPLIRTVYAGSGFLAQSTKSLHFGLGKRAQIESVKVRWPGGREEEFSGVTPNGHFVLTEGTSLAQPRKRPRTKEMTPSIAAEPNLSPSSRVVLLEPAPLPNSLNCTDLDGTELALADAHRNQPLLINLWSTTCANCLHEISEWSQRKSELEAAGLEILAVCVDQVIDTAAERQRISAAAKNLRIPFRVGRANQQMVETLNVFQRAFIGRQTDLPLPSSVLLDAHGRLAVIYKGPVSAAQILTDVELLGASPEQIMDGAIRFPGKWLERPPATQPRQAAMALVEHGYLDVAEQYVHQLLPLYQPNDDQGDDVDEDENRRRREFSSLHQFLGAMMFDKQRYEEAAANYRKALDLFPGGLGLLRELLRTQIKLDDHDGAAETLSEMLKIQPNHHEHLANLARVRVKQGRPDEAIELYERSLAAKVDDTIAFEVARLCEKTQDYDRALVHYQSAWDEAQSPSVANNLAWLLATAPDENLRDGKRAVEIAKQAVAMTSRQVPEILSTLAAAHAENGDFAAAKSTAQEAIALATQLRKTPLAERLRERLTLFENSQPVRTQ